MIENIIIILESNGYCGDIYCGYPIINENGRKDFLKAIILLRSGIYLLYENDIEEKVFSNSLIYYLAQDSSLVDITLNFKEYVKLLNTSTELSVDTFEGNDILSDETLLKINRAIQQSFNLTKTDKRETSSETTLGSLIKKRNNYIGKYDETQFNMVHSTIDSHQRIRGLAGSGKTILMLKKMAYLHFQEPDLKIAFIFYTTSLRSSMIKMFTDFYKDYDRYNEPNFENIKIFHSWGGKGSRGFYSDICEQTDSEYFNYGEAVEKSGGEDPFEFVCKNLHEELKKQMDYKGTYDYIFIDEAQDFGINFFHLALETLKRDVRTGYLIYAYDELQSLRAQVSIPSKVDIFGESSRCKDINLNISYRAPKEILTTAHAIGLGVYRKVDDSSETPLVNFVDETTLLDMGYKNMGQDFKAGNYITLERTKENNTGIEIDAPIHVIGKSLQNNIVAAEVLRLLKEEDVKPSDIMLIDMDGNNLTKNYNQFSLIFDKMLYNTELNKNVHIKLVSGKTPSMTKSETSIIYTTVFRAKGNEANLVFLINCNKIQTSNRNSTYRNEIFTAMTRAKVKVWLYGETVDFLKDEIEATREHDYKLEFIYPTEQQKESIRIMGDSDEKLENNIIAAQELPIEILEQLLKQKLGSKK
ncbi:DEAD/DEAH box helicase [Streptococcus infantis]|uniref:DEAD/DEAH box helicase n=1 Tax=Streptococcus infantis TaxID=68892 RepID=UPI0039C046C8